MNRRPWFDKPRWMAACSSATQSEANAGRNAHHQHRRLFQPLIHFQCDDVSRSMIHSSNRKPAAFNRSASRRARRLSCELWLRKTSK